MLCAYVQDNHRDWGAQISFVMMAYMLARKTRKIARKLHSCPKNQKPLQSFRLNQRIPRVPKQLVVRTES